ncbi:PKD domain-containing protein [Paenibacillus sp. TRM 82003]|nr:PKD domain-containing protein [Paenibacillus sp. TRM 82003]
MKLYHAGGTTYYGVAAGSYDIWRHSDGVTWQNGHAPGGAFTATHSYSFSFPGRVVKSASFHPFAPGGSPISISGLPNGESTQDLFRDVRGVTWFEFRDPSTTASYMVSENPKPVNGIGTSTINFDLTTSGTLEAAVPKPLHLTEDGQHRPDLHPNVRGYSYYFPVLIKLELEPEEPETGTAYIRHFTTTGQSLGHIFPDRDVTLEHGEEYNFIRPTNSAYSYEGYKKRQDAEPPPGDDWDPVTGPGSFEYNSSQFQKYYVYFYYDPLTALEYQLDVQPPTWTMKVGETKGFIAHQRSRRAGSSDSWSSWTPIPDAQVVWTIGNSSIATIDVIGVSRGISVGTTNVRAAWNGLSDSSSLTIEAAAEGGLDGDFTINPSTIDFRDPFSLVPEPFTIPDGCTYTSHTYRFTNGSYAYSSPVTTATATSNFPYSNYPSVLDVGRVNISIKINANCGSETITTGYIKEKPLTVNDDGRPNQGPVFYGGWFDENERNRSRYNEVGELVIGYRYDLGIIEEDHEDPELVLPRDPEGDYPITYTWNFLGGNSEFIRNIYSSYFSDPNREVYKRVRVPDDPALKDTFHTVEVTARDRFGTPVTTDTVHVAIVGPEPRAVCWGNVSVKSGRKFVNTFDTSRSNSPLGRTVTVDRWEGIEEPFINETDVPMNKKVYVWVKDSAGLVSEDPDDCDVTVLPDHPPIAKLSVPSLTVRGQPINILNQSYSVDGDIIVSIRYQYKYDAANNGFEDDAWVDAPGGDLAKLTFDPPKVGKYLFSAVVCEDYGRCSMVIEPADATLRTLDVRNNGPEVSFKVLGENNQPEIDLATYYPVSEILNNWPLVRNGSGEEITIDQRLIRFRIDGEQLIAGYGHTLQPIEFSATRGMLKDSDGRNFEMPYEVSNVGLGNNRLSPYRSPGQDTTNSFILTYGEDPDFVITDSHFITAYGIKGLSYGLRSDTLAKTNKIVAMKKSDMPTATGLVADWEYVLPTEVRYGPTCCNSDGDSYTGYYTARMPFYGILLVDDELWISTYWQGFNTYVLDPATGKEIRRFNIDPTVNPASNLNANNAFVIPGKGEVVLSGSTMAKINRNGEIIQREVPLPPEMELPKRGADGCYPVGASQWWRGDDNDLYRYEWRYRPYEKPCGGSYAYDSLHVNSVIKFDMETMSYQWRTMTPYERPHPQVNFYKDNTTFENRETMFVDTIGKKLIVKSYNATMRNYVMVAELDMVTGAVLKQQFYENIGRNTIYQNPFHIALQWEGNITKLRFPAYTTIDKKQIGVIDPSIREYSGTTPIHYYYWPRLPCDRNDDCSDYEDRPTAEHIMNAIPIGDGLIYSIVEYSFPGSSKEMRMGVIHYAPPSTEPVVQDLFYHGHFISPDTYGDIEYGVTLKMRKPTIDADLVGLSFRMTDIANRYAVEIDGSRAYLSKYVNGTRTVLESISYPFENWKDYKIRVTAQGSRLNVWINGVPFFQDVEDDTFAEGAFGIFTEKSLVHFSKLYTKDAFKTTRSLLANYAIWEEGEAAAKVEYRDISFLDPEHDPQAGSYRWAYTHTPKFLNNHGLSVHHNKTYSAGALVFDKVGEYDIELSAFDDPQPNNLFPSTVFDAYRKRSNPFTQKMIVHRRPVAIAAAKQDEVTGLVTWSDTERSYDPDRWESAANVSPPDTPGMNYAVDKGIKEERFYYVTPGGTFAEGRLTRPEETGTYEVFYQVMDEYGAWSYPWSGTVEATMLPVNEQPVARMSVPSGTRDAPTVFAGLRPVFQWTQMDEDPGAVFGRYHLQITNESNDAYVLDSGPIVQNTGAAVQSYSPSAELPAGRKLRVRVRVDDTLEWSNWSDQTWFVINRPPAAELTFPTGSRAFPTPAGSLRPDVRWTQTDPDPATVFQAYEVEVANEGDTAVAASSGVVAIDTSAGEWSWSVPSDLPAGRKFRVRVRVYDGYAWSSWSAERWLMTNRPPVADFAWSPALAYEGDDLSLENRSADPDGDALIYRWTVAAPDGSIVVMNSDHPTVAHAVKGAYSITLRATDPYGVFDEVTKTVAVGDLSIVGQVAHTAEWERYRLSWNERFPKAARAATDFWGGEALVLHATATDTSTSGTKPVHVVARLMETGESTGLSSGNRIAYDGTMAEEEHARTLEDVPYTMRFTVTWSNGHIEFHDVPFDVRGTIYDVIAFQLRG